MVATKHDRNSARCDNRGNRILEPTNTLDNLARRHDHVARVDSAEVIERIDAERNVRAGSRHEVYVGGANRARSETRSRSITGSSIERGANNYGIGTRKSGRIVEPDAWNAEKCYVWSEHRGHRGFLSGLDHIVSTMTECINRWSDGPASRLMPDSRT
jgi:hypothetical protein